MTNLSSQAAVHVNSAVKGLYTNHSNPNPAGANPSVKALGTNPELAQWLEYQALPYYNAVISGREPFPPSDQWQEFLNQIQWAFQQQGMAWDPGAGIGAGGGNFDPRWGASQQEPDPFGGQVGQNGLVHTEANAKVGFIGNEVRDFWSDEVTIQVASRGAKCKVERSMDTRLQPAEEVLKITVTDAPTGTEATYFIHIPDPENPPKVTLETPNETQVTGHVENGVEWKKFSPSTRSEDGQEEASVEGVEENDRLVYEGRAGQVIQFNPLKGGEGDYQKHEVWGDCSINLGTRDRAVVKQGIPDPANPDGAMLAGTTVIVTHPDTSQDVYYIPHPFKTNVNGIEEFITFETADGAATLGAVPEAFDKVTLNSASSETEENENEEVVVDGDAPTETAEDGTRTWDMTANAEIYTRKDGETGNIYARGEVTLHASSNQEYWRVSIGTGGKYKVEVFDNGAYTGTPTETFFIDPMADKIRLDIDPSHVQFGDGLYFSAPAAAKVLFMNSEGEQAVAEVLEDRDETDRENDETSVDMASDPRARNAG